jgi:hypothetical protein
MAHTQRTEQLWGASCSLRKLGAGTMKKKSHAPSCHSESVSENSLQPPAFASAARPSNVRWFYNFPVSHQLFYRVLPHSNHWQENSAMLLYNRYAAACSVTFPLPDLQAYWCGDIVMFVIGLCRFPVGLTPGNRRLTCSRQKIFAHCHPTINERLHRSRFLPSLGIR